MKTYTVETFFPEGTDRVEWAVFENDDYGHHLIELHNYYEEAIASAQEWNHDEQMVYYAAN